MIHRVVLATLGCLVLGGVVALEAMDDVAGDDIALPAARAADAAVASASLPGASEASVQDVLARPLFTPNRQPSARSGTKAQADAFHRRLTGVAIGPATRKAVFAGEGRDKPAVVAEGEAIEGWTVESVAAGAVTIRAGNASQLVEIARTKAGNAAAKAETRPDNNSTGVSPTRRDR
ncbi:MAG TPA: hypothetical protein VGB82_00685 [Alphaproteobacteria bacterium]